MNQTILTQSAHLRKSFILSAPKNNSRYRISRKNHSMIESNSQLTHSRMLQICAVKNYEQMKHNAIKNENKQLKKALKQLNDLLTYKIQRKKLRVDTEGSTAVSMKQLMEFVPKDLDEQQKKNLQIMEQLKRELQLCLERKRVIQKIDHRIKIQQQITKTAELIRQTQQSIRSLQRLSILKQKQMKAQEKYNEGEEVFRLRRQITRIKKHAQQVQYKLQQTQLQSQKIYQKLMILTQKQSIVKSQYVSNLTQVRNSEAQLTSMNQNNQSYIQFLNKLKTSKRRYHTSQDIFKVKYYNALKKLQVQTERSNKVLDQIQDIDYQILLKKQLADKIAIKMQSQSGQDPDHQEYFQDQIDHRGFMVTQIQSRKSKRDKQGSLPELSKTVQSDNDGRDVRSRINVETNIAE